MRVRLGRFRLNICCWVRRSRLLVVRVGLFTGRLSLDSYPWLADHAVTGVAFVAGYGVFGGCVVCWWSGWLWGGGGVDFGILCWCWVRVVRCSCRSRLVSLTRILGVCWGIYSRVEDVSGDGVLGEEWDASREWCALFW